MSDLLIEVSGPSCPRLFVYDPVTSFCEPPTSISTRSCDSSWTLNGSSGTTHCLRRQLFERHSEFRRRVLPHGKIAAIALVTSFACLLFAQERVDEATDARFWSEEMEHSQLMHTLHILADRYGRRVSLRPGGTRPIATRSCRDSQKSRCRRRWNAGSCPTCLIAWQHCETKTEVAILEGLTIVDDM